MQQGSRGKRRSRNTRQTKNTSGIFGAKQSRWNGVQSHLIEQLGKTPPSRAERIALTREVVVFEKKTRTKRVIWI